MNKFKIFFFFFFILGTNSSFALADDLKKAWSLFFANNRVEAEQLFLKAAADPESKAEAHLGLALLNRENRKDDAAFNHFSEFYRSSKDPFPYTFALWATPCVNSDYNKKSKEKLAILKSMAADPRANQCMQAISNSMIAYHFQKVNDHKQAKHYFQKVAAIPFAQVAGQFENISGSGFNKDFGVLENPGPQAVFRNKVGAEVKWFDIKYARNDKWLDFAFPFNGDEAICYAQAFVNCPAAQEAILRAGASGAIKIWVNDRLVASMNSEKNTDIDVYGYKIKLNKGYNRILVQVGKSEVDRANIIVRLFGADEGPIAGLTYSPKAEPYTKDTVYGSKELPFFAEEFFSRQISIDPANILSYVMLGEVYLRNDNVYGARMAFTKASGLAPLSTYVRERLIECYTREENKTLMTKTTESIKSSDPLSYYALQEFYNDAVSKEDHDEAEKIIALLEKTYGKTIITEALQLEVFKRRKKYEEIIAFGNRMYEAYPDNWELVYLKYTIETSVNTDQKKANKVLVNFLKNNSSDAASEILADNYFKDGKTGKALEIFEERINQYPYGTGYYESMWGLSYAGQDYAAAEMWLKKVLEICPYNASYWHQLGKIYEAMYKTEDAKKAFAKCVYYAPTDYEAQHLLRNISGKKELFNHFPVTDVNKLFAGSAPAKDFPDDNSIILLNEQQRIVYPGGGSELRTDILIKVFNQAGIDAWKEYGISFNQYTQRLIIEKAEVLKADGNKVRAETNGAHIVFTTLEAGDAVHVTYRLEDFVYGQMATHFSDRFNLNYVLPVALGKYSLIVPEEKIFSYKVLNSDLSPVVSTPEEGFRMYCFEKSGMPAIKDEPFMPPLDDIGMVIDVSSIPDWKFVSNWYGDLANSKAKGDYEVKEVVAGLLGPNTDTLSQLEKAKLIYEYIEKNISYSSVSFLQSGLVPQKASRTLNTKLGDCKDVSTLFVAMCREVGIPAALVLVSTRDNGDNFLVQPNVGFNHCIVYAVPDDLPYYLELTDNKLSFSSLGNLVIGAQALQISNDQLEGNSDLYRIDPYRRVLSKISRKTEIAFSGNDIRVLRKTDCSGLYAAGTRYGYADIGTDEQLKRMNEAIGSDFSTPVKLNRLVFSDLKQLSDSVNYNVDFSVSNAVFDVAGMKVIKLPWAEAYRSLDFLASEQRTYPFNIHSFTALDDAKEEIEVEVPKGMKLVSVPKYAGIESELLSYELNFRMAEGKLIATRWLKFNKDVVSPKEYSDFKKYFKAIAEAESQQIVFR